jgi:hypothetical protein
LYNREGRIISKTEEGEETIKICGLNRRDLIRTRLKLRKKYVDKIQLAFEDFDDNNDVGELRGALKSAFREIRDNCDINKEYSLFHVYIYRYFDYFIDNKLPQNLRGLSLKYFNEFKRKNVI